MVDRRAGDFPAPECPFCFLAVCITQLAPLESQLLHQHAFNIRPHSKSLLSTFYCQAWPRGLDTSSVYRINPAPAPGGSQPLDGQITSKHLIITQPHHEFCDGEMKMLAFIEFWLYAGC